MHINKSQVISWMRWIPALLLMGLIYYLSSLQPGDIPRFGWLDTLIKKSAHMAGFGLLALAYRLGMNRSDYAGRWAWGLAVLYAITDEWHQSYVPGRGASALDVGIDAAGAWIALWPLRNKIAALLRKF